MMTRPRDRGWVVLALIALWLVIGMTPYFWRYLG